MSYHAPYNRRGAKARRTNKPSVGGSPPAGIHQRDHQKSRQDHNPRRQQGENQHYTVEKTTRSWADAAGGSPTPHQAIITHKYQTYHTVGKDLGFTYPFAAQPHLMLTRRYSSSEDKKNEIVFRHLFQAGQPATRDLLQRLRTEAHSAIRKRLGMNLLYTDGLGDTVTVVTKKSEQGDLAK